MSKDNSYRQIFKSTSIFGLVQVVNILISIVRSKCIAVFLGPAGMGIVSLLTSTLGLITSLTNFGLSTSAVKNIAAAKAAGDEQKLAKTVAVFRYLVWITGLLGFIITLILAPWLSEIAFESKKYTITFMLISITLLFVQISAGQNVILRGMRMVQYMARASSLGAIAGLFISIPLYMFFLDKGIVPAIILTSISALIISWVYARKVKIPDAAIDKEILKTEGVEMLKMGFLISISGLITTGASYLVRIFISKNGGVEDVGLYTAGFAIIGTYVSMIFTAMSADYYPRLAAVAHDDVSCKKEINQQSEIALLILAPILVLFLVFIQWGITLLYSAQFLGVLDMVHWASIGVFFQALSWSIGFIFLAKSASKIYFWNELIANIYILGLNVAGYYFFGLTGLGISYLVAYFLHFLQMLVVSNKLYNFSLNKNTLRIFVIQLSIATICFVSVYFLKGFLAYLIGSGLLVISSVFSWKELDKMISIKDVFIKLKNKYAK